MTRPTYRLQCLFCGTTKQSRTTDKFLTQTKSKNGNSYDFCRRHWLKLREIATPRVIDTYRRDRLPNRPQNLTSVLDDLAYEMGHKRY